MGRTVFPLRELLLVVFILSHGLLCTAFSPVTLISSPLAKSVSLRQSSSPAAAPLRVPAKLSTNTVRAARPTFEGLKMSSIQASWDNHFSAFGGQDVAQIEKDYAPDCEIIVYDSVTGDESIFKGIDGVRKCFTELFASLSDTSELGVSLLKVQEHPDGHVFLVWQCPSSGITLATDSFAFDDNHKIKWQTIMTWPASAKPTNTPATNTAPTGGPVQKGWDNHFSAFGAQDVPKILLDYTDKSEVTVYDCTNKQTDAYVGVDEVKKLFEGLFATLSDLSQLSVPVIKVYEAAPGKPGLVFLVWKCPSSGITLATDTFLFDAQGKITKQNVVAQFAS